LFDTRWAGVAAVRRGAGANEWRTPRGKVGRAARIAAIQKIIAELARKGLKVDHYAASDRPIFELIEGEGEKSISHPLFSIPGNLAKDLEIGRRGVQIKRFKGLGEMNAKELFRPR
jgi:DNA gyrase subunit B